jgi:uncharacterized protein
MDDILEAIEEGDLGEVEWLVGEDPDLLNGKDDDGVTPLMAASGYGELEMARWLLDRGAAINERDNDGDTALTISAYYGHDPVVRLLLQRGADPTIANLRHKTPLICASSEGYLEVVRLLFSHPSSETTINFHRYGYTALWEACLMGRADVVRALLESGADHTIADHIGMTPMATATFFEPEFNATVAGREECVRLLLERRADPHVIVDGESVGGATGTPLIHKSMTSEVELVRLLLSYPSVRNSINHRDPEGKTALWWACDYGRGGNVRALLGSGADPRIADNDGVTPMAIAEQQAPAWVSAKGRRECVAALKVRCFSLTPSLRSHAVLTSWLKRGVSCLGRGGRRRSGPTCCGTPGTCPTSRGAARWRCRCRGARGKRRGMR